MSVRGTGKSPDLFHPEIRSAVGSRNSSVQGVREQDKEFEKLVNEETEKVISYLHHKLPKEVLERLDVMGGIKEKLYNYFNQNFQNMVNRYITTAEDELSKKFRDFVDKEEAKVLAKYTPKEIADLLDQVGGADRFNTGEVEKSIVNIYGHLQGHVQREMNDIENKTNALLRQKSDIGAFIRGQNSYSVIKCAFKDNIKKPKTVSDVKLSINILDAELISPIFHYQATVEYLIKDQISKVVIERIDQEIEKLKDQYMGEDKGEQTEGEIMIEKINRVTNYTSDDAEDPASRRYTFFAKHLMDKIEGLRAEINPKDFDSLNIRENVKKIVDDENIRNRGFNTVVNSICALLDSSKMGYQYLENMKNGREVLVREYEDTDITQLPDERYQIRLKYYDQAQILSERKAYDHQMIEFQKEIMHVEDVTRCVLDSRKKHFIINDFADLSRKTLSWRRRNKKEGEPLYEEQPKVWDEVQFILPEETEVEKNNRTYNAEKVNLKRRLAECKIMLAKTYKFDYPKQRILLEERILFLQQRFDEFDYAINPYHIQPGIILDIDIASIKRKKFTLEMMANVLNEFLSSVSKGFSDAAFAAYSRRKSTVRSDIEREFKTITEDEEKRMLAGENLNEEPKKASPAASEQPAAARTAKKKKIINVVDKELEEL
ncbi:MAG: cytochrome C oxidase subunit II [Spirochaetes bacterium GWF1_41_5]|nr:MAG: cytochrome C oxidase subunit II [Spirochaetes bacterium GWF1_41_5]